MDVLQQPLNWLPSSRSILSACSELRRTSYGCGVHLSHLAASCGASAPAVCATPAPLAVERFAPALRTCGEAHRPVSDTCALRRAPALAVITAPALEAEYIARAAVVGGDRSACACGELHCIRSCGVHAGIHLTCFCCDCIACTSV